MTTWDEGKRRSNLVKHGVDFASVGGFEWDRAVIVEDASERYGEQRERATGLMALRCTFISTPSATMKTMQSACVVRAGRRSVDMSKSFEPLTPDELAEIHRRRAEARRLVREQLETMTDEEDARLTAAAESDPDNPPLTDEQWSRMRPAHEVHPELVAEYIRRGRGRPKSAAPKQQVTLRIDRDILDHFKEAGPGWQTAINDTLRAAVGTGNNADRKQVDNGTGGRQSGA